jgi:hypothetical protein
MNEPKGMGRQRISHPSWLDLFSLTYSAIGHITSLIIHTLEDYAG